MQMIQVLCQYASSYTPRWRYNQEEGAIEASAHSKIHKRVTITRRLKEDFGKRNMPGKRARTHFSQLSEFERDLIIGMKTARWSTRRVAGQVDRSECAVKNCWEQWTREGTHAWKIGSGATRMTTRIEGSCGKHLWTRQ
ncbi:transposable element Tc1 transposase [Trichonephila clavipes]|nr:transposable element Tc1 transposase [Trichonephila clavipes]